MPAIIDPDGVEIVTMRELVDFEGLRIVEVGCGAGRLTFECGRGAASVLAFDSDKDAIRKARAETPRAYGDGSDSRSPTQLSWSYRRASSISRSSPGHSDELRQRTSCTSC